MKYSEVALCVDWSNLLVRPLAFKKWSRKCHVYQIQFMPHKRGGGFATPNLGGLLPETDKVYFRRAIGTQNHAPSLGSAPHILDRVCPLRLMH